MYVTVDGARSHMQMRAVVAAVPMPSDQLMVIAINDLIDLVEVCGSADVPVPFILGELVSLTKSELDAAKPVRPQRQRIFGQGECFLLAWRLPAWNEELRLRQARDSALQRVEEVIPCF